MQLIGTGREADVYAIGDGRVLRRYREGGDVAREMSVMKYVAAQGFPVPEVYSGDGPDLIMQRVDGPTMLAELFAGRLDPTWCGKTLANLLNKLHTIAALSSPDPTDRVLHLDLHPDNVILTAAGPVVIDWRNGTDGPPGFDNALTAVTIAQAVLSGLVDGDLAEAARALLRAFLLGIDSPIDAHVGRAITMRRNNNTMTAHETGVLDQVPEMLFLMRP